MNPHAHHSPDPFRLHPEPFPRIHELRGFVTRIIDADTVECMLDLGLHSLRTEVLRVRNYNAPEIRRPASDEEIKRGMAAKARAEELLLGQPIIARVFRTEQTFGRYAAEIDYYVDTDAMESYALRMKQEGHEK